MYAPNLGARDRSGALVAVAAIHAALIFALLNLSGTIALPSEQDVLRVFDLAEPEPPPPPVVEVQPQQQPAPEEEGEASPPNIESQATPVVDPEPVIELPVTPPVTVSPTPNEGSEATQGAAPVPGPGTGAGGVGTGTGAGGSGSGTGGGGTGVATRPSIAWPPYPHLSARDYPREMRRRWPRGGRVFAIFRVQVNGTATDCRVDRSFGDAQIDAWTCHLIETKLRFNPARRPNGEPYVSYFGYAQAPVR